MFREKICISLKYKQQGQRETLQIIGLITSLNEHTTPDTDHRLARHDNVTMLKKKRELK